MRASRFDNSRERIGPSSAAAKPVGTKRPSSRFVSTEHGFAVRQTESRSDCRPQGQADEVCEDHKTLKRFGPNSVAVKPEGA